MSMKLFVFLSSSLITLFVFCACSVAQTDKRVDITLQGPWILYQDNAFQDAQHNSVPVLIVMAPGMSNIKTKYRHQPPTFSNGDGYWIKDSGIYCVQFNDVCAPKNPNGSMTSNGYPDSIPLVVKVPAQSPDKWPWYQYAQNTPQAAGTYLILPMPDSISNDGVWPMQFAPQSDYDNPKTPQKYGPSGNSQHSIGIQLHYTSLTASTLSLIVCASPLPSHDSSTCTRNLAKHPLLNSGTLRITMKAPNTKDVCDPHVRAAHREMLHLLDSRSLADPTGPNVNQSLAFIDPARDVDDNHNGVYDDTKTRCRARFDPKQNANILDVEAHDVRMLHEATDVFAQAIGIVGEVDNVLRSNPSYPKEADPYLLLAIKKVGDPLSPKLPSVSQLALLAELITESEGKLKVADKFAKLHLDEQTFIVSYEAQTKGAKDCLAPIMMVGQVTAASPPMP
jgi:hypothetical protein